MLNFNKSIKESYQPTYSKTNDACYNILHQKLFNTFDLRHKSDSIERQFFAAKSR